MSTIDTSTWSPDADYNESIEGIPLNSDAGIAQTWKVIAILMAAMKGDTDAIKAMITVMEGATASADGASGLVPAPEAGDQNKFLKGDGTWGTVSDVSGNAGTATKLKDARTISLTGDVSGSASFDGSANASITATVADDSHNHVISNVDGLQTELDAKAADSAVVHLAEAETVTGAKTFSSPVTLLDSQPCLLTASPLFTAKGTAPSAAVKTTIALVGSTNSSSAEASNTIAAVEFMLFTGGIAGTALRAYKNAAGTAGQSLNWLWDGSGYLLRTGADAAAALGSGSYRWGQIYSTNSAISTSDARLKTSVSALPDAVLDAWGDVDWVQFQMLDAVAEKGAGEARLHNGLIAQHVSEVFKAHGLDASRYGLFCYDEWDDQAEEKDGDGNVVQEARTAGDVYSLRYEEALAMEAAYQRRRADRLEARIAALEEKLNG